SRLSSRRSAPEVSPDASPKPRRRSSSASTSAPNSSATPPSQSQVSMTTTAASEPHDLLYEAKPLRYTENSADAATQTSAATITPAETARRSESRRSGASASRPANATSSPINASGHSAAYQRAFTRDSSSLARPIHVDSGGPSTSTPNETAKPT